MTTWRQWLERNRAGRGEIYHHEWDIDLDKPWDAPRQTPAPVQSGREYLSISDLADRWQCSRGTVCNRLRSVGAEVLDFARCGKRSRKAVSLEVVRKIEARHTKRLC